MAEKEYRNALQPETELHWYRIKKILGQGAFGITYLSDDNNLNREVAIKEYLPVNNAYRDDDKSLQPVSDEKTDDFVCGLERFISEARTLTIFEHPNLVRVLSVFEENNTAYMVMRYEHGKSLQEILEDKSTLTESELIKILFPLLDALETVHEKGFVHRDIKPGNIFIRKDGSPVLLDFGSARQTRDWASPQTLTNFVTPGYAPIEQYSGKSDRQGPWTDIYGLGATLYKAVTGTMPITAVDRSEMIANDLDDIFISASESCEQTYPEKILQAIDHALAFRIEDRPQTVTEWRAEFGVDEKDIETIPMSSEPVYEAQVSLNNEHKTFHLVNTANSSVETNKANVSPVLADGYNFKTLLTRLTSSEQKPILLILFLAAMVIFMSVILWVSDNADSAATRNDTPGITGAKSPATQAQITTLLEQAEMDKKALRLTTPINNNAYDKYQAVLILDADNAIAKSGVQSIFQHYIDLAYKEMEQEKLSRAGIYLDNAAQIVSDSDELVIARRVLKKKIDEQASIYELSDNDMAELIPNSRKTQGNPEKKENIEEKQETSSERVIRSLGGQ